MNETPEMNVSDHGENPEKKWTESITIPVPLDEYLKMKSKIKKLKYQVTEYRNKRYEEFRRAEDYKDKYEAIRADYQKVLGISEETNQ